MQHFFVTPQQVSGEYIVMEGSDVNHMKNVLRMKLGEEVMISDGNNRKYLCTIEQFSEGKAKLIMKEELPSNTELPSRIYLFQGLPKSDKMELIVQKAVELGVYEIIPVSTKRVVVRLDAKKAQKKVERWNSIAQSGAKQSGRGIVPTVTSVMTYKEALDYAKQLDVVLIPYELASGMERTRQIFTQMKPGQSIGFFIGPEGGFEEAEIEQSIEAGAIPITLGKRILRTETAGLACLSILMYHLEEE